MSVHVSTGGRHAARGQRVHTADPAAEPATERLDPLAVADQFAADVDDLDNMRGVVTRCLWPIAIVSAIGAAACVTVLIFTLWFPIPVQAQPLPATCITNGTQP